MAIVSRRGYTAIVALVYCRSMVIGSPLSAYFVEELGFANGLERSLLPLKQSRADVALFNGGVLRRTEPFRLVSPLCFAALRTISSPFVEGSERSQPARTRHAHRSARADAAGRV